jgi:ribosomal protein S18 acetylase RimI-like enzyme
MESTTATAYPPAVHAAQKRESVGKAEAADVPGMARSLAEAFYDDPAFCHCFPNAGRRMARVERGFDVFLRHIYLQHEECYTADGAVGAALWSPPGTWKLGALEQLRLMPAMWRAYRSDLPRVLRILAFIERRHPEESHYYLGFVGVEPSWQGKGLGSALMRPVLERCDRDGVPAYLEASTPRNRDLYERHGFEVVEELPLPGGGPPIWRMWRKPQATTEQP